MKTYQIVEVKYCKRPLHSVLPSSYLVAAPPPTASTVCISALLLPESFYSLCCRHVKGDGNTGSNPKKTTAKKVWSLQLLVLFPPFLSTYINLMDAYIMKTLLLFILILGYFLHWTDFYFNQGISMSSSQSSPNTF